MAKFDYLAPEYVAGGKADARVDIYGLGCVLYEALTGEVPFPGPGAAAKMYAHASSDPPSLRARRPEVPERLDAVVRRALAKDPAERQQSAGEFAIEAAGAVELSAPLWAARAAPSPSPSGGEERSGLGAPKRARLAEVTGRETQIAANARLAARDRSGWGCGKLRGCLSFPSCSRHRCWRG